MVEVKSGLQFVDLPAGSFQFQGERTVAVAAFRMGVTAVTTAAYARCVEARACTLAEGQGCNSSLGIGLVLQGVDRLDHPVNCVDFDQATAFCRWVGGRLPTEEEREYAASGGSEDRVHPWGEGEPGERACWSGAAPEAARKSTCPVGAHRAGASRWGQRDLAGNVWEWTTSDYVPLGRDRTPVGKVVRGGSWKDPAERLRARSRHWLETHAADSTVGFRCVF